MKKICMLGFFLMLNHVKASEPITLLGQMDNTYPPFYMMGSQSGKPWQGIWPGVVQGTMESFKMKVQWELLSREKVTELGKKHGNKRQSHLFEYNKHVTCTVDSPQWMGEAASSFYLSDIVVELKDFLIYQKGDFKTLPKLEDLPQGEKIAVCKGWGYAELQPHFESKRFVRYDVDPADNPICELEMLKAIEKKEVRFAFLNPDVLGYLIKEKKLSKGIYAKLDVPGTPAGLTLVCNKTPESKLFVEKFNAKLTQMIDLVPKIRQRYVSGL